MTTGPTTLMNLASSFDRRLANVWGQTEGTESRELMVTGLFGPQTDIDRLPNWGRNLTTTGEDPFLSAARWSPRRSTASRAPGTLSQMKHFAVYNGQNQNTNTADLRPGPAPDLPDPVRGRLRQRRRGGDDVLVPDLAGHLDDAAVRRSRRWPAPTPLSPYAAAGQNPQTWPLNESHFSCEQPLTLTYALRDLWGSKAMVGSDYPATHSTSAIYQGEDQEQPTTTGYFSDSNSLSTTSGGGSSARRRRSTRPATPAPTPRATPSPARRPARSTWPACPDRAARRPGCTLVEAVANGSVPLSVFNQALATMLYQEQRFGMLGCDQTPVAATCTNPGGINGDRTGTAPLPAGPAHGATPTADLGTKNGDAAVVEKMSEEGAVLLKNDSSALPITQQRPAAAAILVTGPGAEYTIADPTGEASVGFADRDAISPLEQLKAFSGDPGAFTYVPANSPSGEPVPSSALSDSTTSVTGAPGPHDRAGLARRPILARLHHRLRQRPARARQLHLDRRRVRAGDRHLHVPVPVQQRASRPPNVTFSLDGDGADAEHGRRTSTATA